MTPVRLEARGLTRAFGEHYALIEVNAQWRAGEICALLGPNGAGKSTLLNLLSTLMAPSEGEMILEGERLSKSTAPKLRRKIGFVGHQTMVYSALSASENLRFFANLYDCWPPGVRGDHSEETEWIHERLSAVGLAAVGPKAVSGFSRGMSQRLTLARALLPSPSVLLLDEPFTGLDRSGIDLLCELLEQARSGGATVIMSSHDLETSARLANKALILKRGRLQTFKALQDRHELIELYQQVTAS